MSDILVTSPYRPFTLPTQFKAVFNGYIYCGTVDAADPSVSQVQVYLANEDGSRTPVAQPLRTNAGGYLVYNGQPAKFVTDSNHSLLVRDYLGMQVWYAPDVASIDPDSFAVDLSGRYGSGMVGKASYADVREYSGNNKSLTVYGRALPLDGGSGVFCVDESDLTTADNDGTVLIDAVGRRWKRVIEGDCINVLWFGANNNGTINSRSQINAAIKFASESGGGTVYLPSGDYLILSDGGGDIDKNHIVLRSFVTLIGSSRGASKIVRGSASTIMVTEVPSLPSGFNYHKNISLKNLVFDGNYSQQFYPANIVKIDSCTNLSVNDCEFMNTPGLHSLDLNRCKHVRIGGCMFYGTSQELAIQFAGANYNPEAIQISWGDDSASQYYCEDVKVFNCVFDKNKELPGSDFFISAFGNHSSLNSGRAVMRDIEFYGNTVVGCTQAAVKALPCVGYSVHDNVFRDCTNVFGIYADFHPEFGLLDIKDVSFVDNIVDGFSRSVVYSVQLAYDSPNVASKINNLIISGNTITGQEAGSASSVIDCILVDGYIVDNNIVRGDVWRFIQHEYCRNTNIDGNIIESTIVNSINVIEQRNANLNNKGLSSNISISRNKIMTSKQRGIHVNCAASDVLISGNTVANSNTEAGGMREAIKVDSYPTNVSIVGNSTYFNNGIPYTYGILASTVNDCYISGNKTQPGTLGATASAASGTTSTIFLDGERVTENPEGVHIASVGSSVVNINGSSGAVRYLKESGTQRTGWVAK